MTEHTSVRGTVWFRAFTGQVSPMPGDPKSVLYSGCSAWRRQRKIPLRCSGSARALSLCPQWRSWPGGGLHARHTCP